MRGESGFNYGLMPQSDARNSAQLLCERSKSLHEKSAVLRQEADELCFASHRLRKAITSLTHTGHVLKYTNFRITGSNLTSLEVEKNLPKIESAGGVLSSELIRIRTPGFNRNAARKIIKPEN